MNHNSQIGLEKSLSLTAKLPLYALQIKWFSFDLTVNIPLLVGHQKRSSGGHNRDKGIFTIKFNVIKCLYIDVLYSLLNTTNKS